MYTTFSNLFAFRVLSSIGSFWRTRRAPGLRAPAQRAPAYTQKQHVQRYLNAKVGVEIAENCLLKFVLPAFQDPPWSKKRPRERAEFVLPVLASLVDWKLTSIAAGFEGDGRITTGSMSLSGPPESSETAWDLGFDKYFLKLPTTTL